jgi:hypothetical protein
MPPIVIALPIIGAVTISTAEIAITLATSVLLPLITSLLFGKPVVPTAPKPSLSQTIKGSVEARRIIYGEMVTGGVLVYAETARGPGGNNQALHTVVAFAGHECDSISDVYFDDKLSTDPIFIASGGSPLYLINKHLGTATQTVDTTLQSEIPKWDSSHRLQGICYLYTRLYWQNQPATFRSGIPDIRAKIKGKKVYDPRTGVTAWSNNAALCTRDYLVTAFGVSDAEIDDALVIAAANICDEVVGGQARYTCDGVGALDEKPLDVLEDLVTCMAGAVVYSQGKFRIYAGAAGTKTVTIDRTWLRDQISVDARPARQDLFNAVRGTFTDPGNDWQSADFPPLTNPTYAAQDGETIYRDIALRFTVDSTKVRPQRIGKIFLEKSRQGIRVTVPCNFSALAIAPWDVIGITEPLLGWTDKDFRVIKWTLAEGGGVDLVCQEEAASSYDWNDGDATVIDAAPDTNLNDPFDVDPPGTPMVVETLVETRAGAGVASLATITWGASDDGFAKRYRVQYKLHAASTWKTAGETEDLEFEILDLAAGTYDFQVAAINSFGTLSAYSSVSKTLVGLTAPPVTVSNFNLVIRNGQALLSWSRATDLDVLHGGYVQIRWSPATSGATWATAIDMVRVAGSATEASVAAATGSYLARFVDSSGNISATDAVVTTTLPDILGMNVVATQAEATGWTGSKTNTVKSGSVLQLDGASSEGYYAFSAGIDIGSVQTSRVTANLAVSVFDVGNLIDARLDPIDSWASFDGSATGAEATAELQVRTTNDDPAGSPTWSAWVPVVIADFTCRAFQFRLHLTTTDLSFNVAVSTGSVTVDMPDRVQSGSSTSSSSADTTVTFPAAFKSTTPRIGFTIRSAATGDYIDLVSVGATSFAYNVRNSSSARVAKTVDWLAKAY